MPRIFDNIDQKLLPALAEGLGLSYRADFAVGYLNLRGWRGIASGIEGLAGGEGRSCRLLVGMTRPEREVLRRHLGSVEEGIDLAEAVRLRRGLVEDLREQLTVGIPTAGDEAGLRELARQLRSGKLRVKVFLRHLLHAKLYLLFRQDTFNPLIGFVGSSNLTFAGLERQGELNLETLDRDQGEKLAKWFEDRWGDRFALDVTADLITLLEESWAGERVLPPYWIYLKMAYHLSREARAGLAESVIPPDIAPRLLPFQTAAVQIGARLLRQRGGVFLGDVVGLGKTLMATALARVMEEQEDADVLIVCPKNLVPMWEDYRERFRLRGRIVPLSRVARDLPALRPYRLVILDESHNLRNPDGKRYRELREYVARARSKLILLSATPYNKSLRDLGAQLGLFLAADQTLPVRPERLLREMGESEFVARHQISPATLAAFEKSDHADDWRELMRLFLIRRTRTFVARWYTKEDAAGRRYLELEGGRRAYFPERTPKTVRYDLEPASGGASGTGSDPTAALLADDVVDRIDRLRLPRYGLGTYLRPALTRLPTEDERQTMTDLSRAGGRLRGFCRVGLFKRLESCGYSFVRSVERHLLRNEIFLHALQAGEPLPIGPQEAALLDGAAADAEIDPQVDIDLEGLLEADRELGAARADRARRFYEVLHAKSAKRFRWLGADLFTPALAVDLRADSDDLEAILALAAPWRANEDRKLAALRRLLLEEHPGEKVLVFSEFADTVAYLERELRASAGFDKTLAAVTGATADPTALAWRFSPVSNDQRQRIGPESELRVLLATDVLSEGQNLQDARIVVNYDLPWAIIRLIQRVGRVDRLGQEAEHILCYSFLPSDGVERILRLRARVRQRLRQNAEVVGTDEHFFEDDQEAREERALVDLYHEKSTVLDDEADEDVDLGSTAWQAWRNAIEADPTLEQQIRRLPDVVYSTRRFDAAPGRPEGVLVYLRTADGTDELGWIDPEGRLVSQSPLAILNAAACHPDTPGEPRRPDHHELIAQGLERLTAPRGGTGGAAGPAGLGGLGRPSAPRYRVYERLKRYAAEVAGGLFDRPEIDLALDALYQAPLTEAAADRFDRLLRARVSNADLADTLVTLYEDGRLTIELHEIDRAPRILCSLGLLPR